MFLSKIINKLESEKNSLKLFKVQTKKLYSHLFYLKKRISILKKKKKIKNLHLVDNKYNKLGSTGFTSTLNPKFFLNNSKQLKIYTRKEALIVYIIIFHLSNTNTLVHITDIKGNLKFSCSAGSVKLNGKQKKKQPTALINILKILLIKVKFLKNKPIAIHFKNTNANYELFVINLIKTQFFIKAIKSYNLKPHNGCRPKKIKRIKRKRKYI